MTWRSRPRIILLLHNGYSRCMLNSAAHQENDRGAVVMLPHAHCLCLAGERQLVIAVDR